MRFVVAVIQAVVAVLLLVAVALNFANIVGRYVLLRPIESAEEIMLFLLVGAVFLGNSVVAWQGRQIRMDVLVHMMPRPVQRALDVLADIAAIVVSVILIVVGLPAVQMLAEFDQRSQAAEIPLVIPQALVPVGLGLTALLLLARVLTGRTWRGVDDAVDPGPETHPGVHPGPHPDPHD